MRRYFYSLCARYLSILVRPTDRLVELNPMTDTVPLPERIEWRVQSHPQLGSYCGDATLAEADYVLLNGNLHYERDVQTLLTMLQHEVAETTRVVIVYYSALWRPLTRIASALGWRAKTPEENWLAPSDVRNLLALSSFEPVQEEKKVLLPLYVPLLSALLNRFVAPLPGFRSLCMMNVLVARPIGKPRRTYSVSVIVPARNEAGNIDAAVSRLPKLGSDDEIIFVEGGSRDGTWDAIVDVQQRHGAERSIVALRQPGQGKGDAVRTGFAAATKDVLIILDADLTVPPEDLPKFCRALEQGRAEFVNGSRLVYPMERGAMRFLNLVANKFFATAFSFVLGQPLKDTLCGTKALLRAEYERIAAHREFFGEFDPFGDFDLIFGAARRGLKIVEVPIRYRERTYGSTNISRWRHGALLFAMLAFAARRLKFV